MHDGSVAHARHLVGSKCYLGLEHCTVLCHLSTNGRMSLSHWHTTSTLGTGVVKTLPLYQESLCPQRTFAGTSFLDLCTVSLVPSLNIEQTIWVLKVLATNTIRSKCANQSRLFVARRMQHSAVDKSMPQPENMVPTCITFPGRSVSRSKIVICSAGPLFE